MIEYGAVVSIEKATLYQDEVFPRTSRERTDSMYAPSTSPEKDAPERDVVPDATRVTPRSSVYKYAPLPIHTPVSLIDSHTASITPVAYELLGVG